jgi:hypothetical protein
MANIFYYSDFSYRGGARKKSIMVGTEFLKAVFVVRSATVAGILSLLIVLQFADLLKLFCVGAKCYCHANTEDRY